MEIKKTDLINHRDRFVPTASKKVLKIDKQISDIVGKQVVATDMRLVKLVVKWKNENPKEDMTEENYQSGSIMDNFLQDPVKLAELKETFK